jgi:hypothetical protein
MVWTARVHFPAEQWWDFFLLSTASTSGLGSTQLHVQWVLDALTSEVKRPGREADYFRLMPIIKMHGAIRPLPNTSSWRGAYLSTGTILRLPLPVICTSRL